MGQLPNDYSIAQDGTIVRNAEEPQKSNGSNGGMIFFIILLICGFIIFVGVVLSREKDASRYAYNMNSYFEYPTWRSYNHKDGSTSSKEYTIALDYYDELTVEYSVSSEPSYDVLTITLISPNGEEDVLCSASGVENQTVYRIIYSSGGVYKLKVQYKKDNSYSKNGDVASIVRLCVHKGRLQDIRNILWN